MADILDLKAILSHRDNDGTVNGVTAAIEKAEAAREHALDQVEESKQRARDLLMTGTLAEIKSAEGRADEAGLAADRLSIIVDQLRGQLRGAQARAALSDAEHLKAAALAADAEFARAWPTHTAALEGLATVHNALVHRFAALQAAAHAGAAFGALPGSDVVPAQELQTAIATIAQFAPSIKAAAHAAAVAMDNAERARRAAEAAARARISEEDRAALQQAESVAEPRGARAEPDPIVAIMADPWAPA